MLVQGHNITSKQENYDLIGRSAIAWQGCQLVLNLQTLIKNVRDNRIDIRKERHCPIVSILIHGEQHKVNTFLYGDAIVHRTEQTQAC